MTHLYFAYGSNLKLARLQARVPSARFVARARLPDGRLSLNKRGRDGSGKANLAPEGGAGVWGVLYDVEPEHWTCLDGHEQGYARADVRVVTEEGAEISALTYVATTLTDEPVAFDWYKRLIVEGAREHGLPSDWVAALERLPEKPDPRRLTGSVW